MQKDKLHSLIPLAEFKTVLGLDDREDALSRYCLVTAAYTIEQYCMRRLIRKKHFEQIEFTGDLLIPLRDYPVVNVLVVYALFSFQHSEIVEPEFYRVIPDCGSGEDLPFSLSLSPAMRRYPGLAGVKAVYNAGYAIGKAPPDLGTACLELAAWNMSRYKGRRVGMTGSVRGQGRDGEHFEMTMPENVKTLLEPYRRRMI